MIVQKKEKKKKKKNKRSNVGVGWVNNILRAKSDLPSFLYPKTQQNSSVITI